MKSINNKTNIPENHEECRNCKSLVQSKIRRCQYCGILNPTVKTKDIFITILAILSIMSLYSYFIS